ncbi:MAG: putative selenium-dependent hydroxylase accessory protein YqeC [Anaerolineales bacterium]|nr:putative selenium-dependent hydroxylase accessory protein YqeC [Anaerolineales bacterium]
MELTKALRISPGQIVAFVGAGGKSSSIRRLIEELTPKTPVLITTTTKLALDQTDLAAHHIILRSKEDMSLFPALLQEQSSVLVTGERWSEESKWTAPPEDLLAVLLPLAASSGAVVLIEADGARDRSLKAPAEHEPVIPPFVDLVVPVMGLDAIGTELEGDLVYRPELVKKVLGIQKDHILQPTDAAKLLAHGNGALKSVPERAQVRVILNKAETQKVVEHGREIAKLSMKTDLIGSVILAHVQQVDPVVEAHGRIAGIILAGGGSRRFGRPKLLEILDGEALIQRSVRAAREAGLDPIVVVLGADGWVVREALGQLAIQFTNNPDWAEGQSSSVRAGLKMLAPNVDGAVFLLADMPLVDADLVSALVETHRKSLEPIVAPWTGERWGNPVLFDRATFEALRRIRGDQGGRALFKTYSVEAVPWGHPAMLDIDTPDDLDTIRGM